MKSAVELLHNGVQATQFLLRENIFQPLADRHPLEWYDGTGDEYRHTMLIRREPLSSIFALAVIAARHVPNNQVPTSSTTKFGTKHHVMYTEMITNCTIICITASRSCIISQLWE
jgi:hypothetical protein